MDSELFRFIQYRLEQREKHRRRRRRQSLGTKVLGIARKSWSFVSKSVPWQQPASSHRPSHHNSRKFRQSSDPSVCLAVGDDETDINRYVKQWSNHRCQDCNTFFNAQWPVRTSRPINQWNLDILSKHLEYARAILSYGAIFQIETPGEQPFAIVCIS